MPLRVSRACSPMLAFWGCLSQSLPFKLLSVLRKRMPSGLPEAPPGKQVRLGREPTALQDPLGASGPVEIASLLGTSELKHG